MKSKKHRAKKILKIVFDWEIHGQSEKALD